MPHNYVRDRKILVLGTWPYFKIMFFIGLQTYLNDTIGQKKIDENSKS